MELIDLANMTEHERFLHAQQLSVKTNSEFQNIIRDERKVLKDCNLEFKEVPGDGNCLFS